MKRPWQTGLVVALLLALGPNLAWAQRFDARSIEVDVVNDRGRAFPQYPVRRAGGPMSYRAHLEAVQGQRYAIQIRNRTNRADRGGDRGGRTQYHFSGERSNLGSGPNGCTCSDRINSKRMTAGGPVAIRVNRFYFTDAGDSYAGAWGDHSAMGVIAVAAFRESPLAIRRHLDSLGPRVGRSGPRTGAACRARRPPPRRRRLQYAVGAGHGLRRDVSGRRRSGWSS
jgi:hypothetical protein